MTKCKHVYVLVHDYTFEAKAYKVLKLNFFQFCGTSMSKKERTSMLKE